MTRWRALVASIGLVAAAVLFIPRTADEQVAKNTGAGRYRDGRGRFGREGPPATGSGASPLLTGLISYYSLNSDSSDATGAANGTDTAITYSAGKIGNCATGNGTTSKIALGSAAQWELQGDFTFSAWVSTGSNWNYDFVVTKQPYWEFRMDTAGYVSMLAGAGGVSTGYGGVIGVTAPSTGNVWHHVVGQRCGTSYKVWLDNALDATHTDAVQAAGAGTAVWIGTRADNFSYLGNQGFKVDEIGLWGVCLAEAEIGLLNNSGAGRAYPF